MRTLRTAIKADTRRQFGRFDIWTLLWGLLVGGSWPSMERMAREVASVGRAYYLQTQYFWFPIAPR